MLDSILDRVSYHAVYDASIVDAIRYARENGFSGIQIADETPHMSLARLSRDDLESIATLSNASAVRIGIHGPDEAVSLFQHDEALAAGVRSYYCALFAAAERINAHLITIHIGSITRFRTDSDPEISVPDVDIHIYAETLRNNLDAVLDLAGDRFVICVENYGLDATVLDLLQPYLASGKLALCWDLAKSHGDAQLQAYFSSNLHYVKQVHLHDIGYSRKGERRSHRVIGSGEVDFTGPLRQLGEADVLDYCIEVRPREKAAESLKRLRDLIGGRRDATP